MIVFSEFSPRLPPSASTVDLRKATEAAKLTGCEVYFIPLDFEQCDTALDKIIRLFSISNQHLDFLHPRRRRDRH